MPSRQVVDHRYLVTGFEEPGDDDAADVAGTPCDEHVHPDRPKSW